MFKRLFVPAKGVSNIELFYDLIFVYCISVITGLMHHPAGGFFDAETFHEYAFTFLVVMQVWFFTTFLLNRYGDGSAAENTCLFVNMFLLYFLAACVDKIEAAATFSAFNLVWALIIGDILVHWVLKRLRYTNLDNADKKVMDRTILVLAVQIVVILAAAFLHPPYSGWAAFIGFLFGWLTFAGGKRVAKEESRFDHLAERCGLLVIVTFGETIVAIATYMGSGTPIVYSIFVFALVVGLFLVYFYEHDRMLDHHSSKSGIVYMLITVWIVLMISNITVALEYMPDDHILYMQKNVYLLVVLVLYLVTSFMVSYFNKPQFKVSIQYAVGRLIICVVIVACAILTHFDPLINLIVATLCIYLAIGHEVLLYHGRTVLMERSAELGIGYEDAPPRISQSLFDREVRKVLYEAMIGKRNS